MTQKTPLTSDTLLLTELIIQEYAGIERNNEPVTVGIPFKKGQVTDPKMLSLSDPENGYLALQAENLLQWPDGSAKWVLFDFQASVEACKTKRLELKLDKAGSQRLDEIKIRKRDDVYVIETGEATFTLDEKIYKPFSSIVIDGNEIIDGKISNVTLKGEDNTIYSPAIDKMFIETEGPVRITIKVEGKFKSEKGKILANFFSRMHFYFNSSAVKIDFTLHNPKAAKHPGGLWDLGDPGSIYFKDLSLCVALNEKESLTSELRLYEDPVPMDYQDFPKKEKQQFETFQFNQKNIVSDTEFRGYSSLNPHTLPSSSLTPDHMRYASCAMPDVLIYQDSSGGENWRSRNHVNKDNEVKTTFRGYKILEGGKVEKPEGEMVGGLEGREDKSKELSAKSMASGKSGMRVLKEGFRANPILTLHSSPFTIEAGIQYFWQNFPKALECDENKLILRLFPEYFNDLFELQGGEQKTHTFYLNFSKHNNQSNLDWVQSPLIAHATPEYCVSTNAIPFLILEKDNQESDLLELVNVAIKGDNTFFKRREIIDEYGWRNFGDLYADHEAVGHEGPEPLISHYNNQYDCIYGALYQFFSNNDLRWFILADQLTRHVIDIDIYHTENDRPEYNKGMFWHTEHYINVETATHRCYSIRHLGRRDLKAYGGGPSASHLYSQGLLNYYYLSGQKLAYFSVKHLAEFISNNLNSQKILKHLKSFLKKIILYSKHIILEDDVGIPNEIYKFDGPGRESGNAISTLMDCYQLGGEKDYLRICEKIIRKSIHPHDIIEKRDLTDAENRWMYLVFLQGVAKYLEIKSEFQDIDDMYKYTRSTLLNYSRWMVENETLFLNRSEILEFPNETWPAQDIRKAVVLLVAAKYSHDIKEKKHFIQSAKTFYRDAISQLLNFQTKCLTRPIVLIMLYGFIPQTLKNNYK